jgi:hypothetical protein
VREPIHPHFAGYSSPVPADGNLYLCDNNRDTFPHEIDGVDDEGFIVIVIKASALKQCASYVRTCVSARELSDRVQMKICKCGFINRIAVVRADISSETEKGHERVPKEQ